MSVPTETCKPCQGCNAMCLLSCTQESPVPKCVTENILRQQLGIQVSEERKSDRLDFYDLHVSSVKKAIERAFLEGRASVLRAQGVSEENILTESMPTGPSL